MKRKLFVICLGSALVLLFIAFIIILPKIKEAQDTVKYSNEKYNFALYYADESASANKKMFTKKKFNINKVILGKEPFLTENDITYYDWNKHQFLLNKPILIEYKLNWYNPFFLLVNGKRIYMGFVYAPIASFGPPGDIMLTEEYIADDKQILTLVNFYNKSEAEELLNNKIIYDVLKDSGKLKE